MSNAKKYFDLPSPDDISQDASSSSYHQGIDGIEDVVGKVNRKVNDGSRRNTADYNASLPEQIIPDNGFIDEVVSGAGGAYDKARKGKGSGSASRGGGRARVKSPSPPVATPPPGSGKLAYLVGEMLQIARDTLVDDPDDRIYQLSRKIGSNVLPESDHWADDVAKEVAGIGVYLLVDKMIGKIPYNKK